MLPGMDTREIYRKPENATADFLKRKSKQKNSYLRQSATVQLNLPNLRSKKSMS